MPDTLLFSETKVNDKSIDNFIESLIPRRLFTLLRLWYIKSVVTSKK